MRARARVTASAVCVAGSLILAMAGCAVERQLEPEPVVTSSERAAAARATDESREARRREAESLIRHATRASTRDDLRSLSALAAADAATGEVAATLRAIDSARRSSLTNLQNIDTTAYKSSAVKVNGGSDVAAYVRMDQGSLENTGRPLDLGVHGNGFFRIKIADSMGGGVGYTRNGNFFINAEGELVLGLGDGYKLMPPIIVPTTAEEISISQDGRIDVRVGGSTGKTNVGQLQLWTFINPEGLQMAGGSVLTENEWSGPPNAKTPGEGGSGQILQGYLEDSNVDLVRERLRLEFLNEWRAAMLGATPAGPQNATPQNAAPQNSATGE